LRGAFLISFEKAIFEKGGEVVRGQARAAFLGLDFDLV
jgi:hypothetical protein